MSFSTLPPELQEDIIRLLPEATLQSLCLVSKSILALARPLLYRHVSLRATSVACYGFKIENGQVVRRDVGLVKWEDKDVQNALPDMVRQAKLCNALLEAHPDLTSLVKSLKISLDGTLAIGFTQYGRLLTLFRTTLAKLSVFREREGYDDANNAFLFDHCPRTLKHLELSGSPLSEDDVYDLLQQLPLLESLSLRDCDASQRQPSPSLPTSFPRLRHLSLWSLERRPSFYATVQRACPFRHSLSIDYTSINSIDPAYLSTISHLVIRDDGLGHTSTPEDFSIRLVSILTSSESLKSFDFTNMFPWSKQYLYVFQFELDRILHHLPSSLVELTLDSIYFSPSYFIDFLSTSDTTTSLRTLNVSHMIKEFQRSRKVYDRVADEIVEDICEERNIELTWVDDISSY